MSEEVKTRPEPPKDENGNPIAPPKGFKPPKGFTPPKDENGNPIAPPNGFKPHHKDGEEAAADENAEG